VRYTLIACKRCHISVLLRFKRNSLGYMGLFISLEHGFEKLLGWLIPRSDRSRFTASNSEIKCKANCMSIVFSRTPTALLRPGCVSRRHAECQPIYSPSNPKQEPRINARMWLSSSRDIAAHVVREGLGVARHSSRSWSGPLA
jgi:hypothetical protein